MSPLIRTDLQGQAFSAFEREKMRSVSEHDLVDYIEDVYIERRV